MEQKFDPVKAKKVIDFVISVLTAIGGFLVGMGASSCTRLF